MVLVFPHFVILMTYPLFGMHSPPLSFTVCVRVCVCLRTYTLDLSIIKWSCDLIVEKVVQSLMPGEAGLRERYVP